MKTIRNCVFETNSSSCHCVTIMKPSVYEPLKNKEVVLHNVYNEACEYEDISVTVRPYDMINIKDLHEEFLFEFYKSHELENWEKVADSYYNGIWDAFNQFIHDIEFFKKLIFFEEANPTFKFSEIYDGIIAKAPCQDEMTESWLRKHTPEWIMAWLFRGWCSMLNINFVSYNRDFEDENLSIGDFEKDGDYYKADHNITC